MTQNYFSMNVPGKHGYSFVVSSTEVNDEDDALDLSAEFGLFEDDEDADYAVPDTISEDEVKHFCGYYDLDNNGEFVSL